MPICTKCNTRFPNRIEIDGIVRIVGKRKYCLTCSPFGLHNTRKIHLGLPRVKRGQRKPGSLKAARAFKKRQIIALFGGKCMICGYSRCLSALDFHHVNPDEKVFNLAVANINFKSKISVLEEVRKTVLLCGDCHAELHAGLHLEIEADWKSRRLVGEDFLIH